MRNTNEILKNPKVWDHKPDLFMHCAMVKLPDCGTCSVIWSSNEGGYEHVSVSPKKKFRIPTWDDMCALKDIFFGDEEEVYQIHPKKSHYVNLKENCLHLWKPNGHELDDLLEMENGWIPVAEKLPESKEKGGYMVNYLVCTEDGSVDIGNYVESVGKWFVLGIQSDVIAWMALPEAYKAVN